MTLTSGTKLGLYEILSPLGAGGMGEVYLAADSKLDRQVAIKVLPGTMTRDKERVARFEREAKLLASLNHPNIAAIYGFDEFDGSRFLVMEHVEGATLGSHLGNGPVAIEDALDIARQIAEALEAAHGQGVVHRDLKPANVMIRPDGAVKVLDFGLAKAMAEESSSHELANSPTITANYTRPGVVLGTAAYMSPEQARGRPLDKRTDIWSLGIILFECLTGERLFQGETANDSMGAIMHKEPEWSLLPPGTPPTIQLLLRRCLTKDRKRRLHDIADARIEIENALVDPNSTSLGLARAALNVKTRWLPTGRQGVLMAILLIVTAAAVWSAKRLPDVEQPIRNLTVFVPDDRVLFGFPPRMLAISRDGTHIAYIGSSTAEGATFSQLNLRALDQPEAVAVPNGADCVMPCFSPDGQWLAFGSRNVIKKVSTRGGPSSTICKVDGWTKSIEWGVDDTIVFSTVFAAGEDGMFRVLASGGDAEPILQPEADTKEEFTLPHFLPDASGITFTAFSKTNDWESSSIRALRFADGVVTELVSGGSDGRYVPTGHLVYRRKNTLLAAPFDLESLEVAGPSVPVMENIGSGPGVELATQLDYADDGTLLYAPGGETLAQKKTLFWLDESGNRTAATENRGGLAWHSFSPDGSFVAVQIRDEQGGENKIHILERERDLLRRLTSASGSDGVPVWSPDGKWIVFNSDRGGGKNNLYRIRTDFSSEVERLTTSDNYQFPGGFSPDGRRLVFHEQSEGQSDLYLLGFDDQGNPASDPELFVSAANSQEWARFSPDGKWVTYMSGESGEMKVYVKAASGEGPSILISTGVGFHPRWSPTENRLFYTTNWAVRNVFSVSFTDQAGVFKPSLPEKVFDLTVGGFIGPGFEVSHDGQRFSTVMASEEDAAIIHPRIILNWFADLRAKVPTDAR